MKTSIQIDHFMFKLHTHITQEKTHTTATFNYSQFHPREEIACGLKYKFNVTPDISSLSYLIYFVVAQIQVD